MYSLRVTCLVVHCGAPPSLDNGLIVNVTSLYYDGVASFACLSGFQFVDATNTKAVCQETGAWTSPSTCQGARIPLTISTNPSDSTDVYMNKWIDCV